MTPPAKIRFVAAAILLAGLGSAAAIQLTAEAPVENRLVQEFENSKAFRHGLEAYGGTFNLLAADFSSWFAGLWHGKSLAVTLAALSLAISATLFRIASRLPDNNKH